MGRLAPGDMNSNYLNMRRLREHTWYAPQVYESNWGKLVDEGWRFLMNVPLGDYATAISTIRDYQQALGKEKVTVGQPFDKYQFKPFPFDHDLIGIYIKDVGEEVLSLHRDCLRWPDFDPTDWA